MFFNKFTVSRFVSSKYRKHKVESQPVMHMGTDGCVEEHEHHRGKIKTQKEISCKVDAENKLLTEIVWVSGSRSSNIQRLHTAAE